MQPRAYRWDSSSQQVPRLHPQSQKGVLCGIGSQVWSGAEAHRRAIDQAGIAGHEQLKGALAIRSRSREALEQPVVIIRIIRKIGHSLRILPTIKKSDKFGKIIFLDSDFSDAHARVNPWARFAVFENCIAGDSDYHIVAT
jgi:hypothetical protein